MERVSKETDGRLWSNVNRDETDPCLIAARMLIDRGITDIWIEDQASTSNGQLLADYVAIWGTQRGVDLMDRINNHPEHDAVSMALRSLEPNTSPCTWSEETDRKVIAMFWQRKAENYRSVLSRHNSWSGLVEPGEDGHYQKLIAEADSIARRQLLGGKLPPLTNEDIVSIVQGVVEKVLDDRENTWDAVVET